jgi:TPP-dependent pyruvate/acetoin dehydrogenase alpha subunit
MSAPDDAALTAMLRARRLEEAACEAYGLGLMRADLRVSIGQEAAHVGLRLALRPQDALFVGARSLGHASAAGLDPAEILADLRDGGLRALRREPGFDVAEDGASALRRAQGWTAARRAGQGGVAVAVLDDVEARQAGLAEAPPAAPILVVIEDARALPDNSAEMIDGLDLPAVRAAVAAALAGIEAGGGSVVLRLHVGRYRGWSMAEPERWSARGPERRPRGAEDCLTQERARLAGEGMAPERFETLDDAARREARAALGRSEALLAAARAEAGA